jgi:putative phosphoribosyl transferase
MRREVVIPPYGLLGTLSLPQSARSLIIFAHGSGSSRLSPRNVAVADALNDFGFATLLFDLLKPDEARDRANVFNISLLAKRLEDAVRWCGNEPETQHFPVGLFGASTGAAAALVCAAQMGERVSAVVSRGGRPDLAEKVLGIISAPTLLIVGGADVGVIELNEAAFVKIRCPKALEIVPGATHLFEERGALERVVELSARWFRQHLVGGTPPLPTDGGRGAI